MLTPNFLVLTGDGINCENETAIALEEAGANTTVMHINDLIFNPDKLNHYQGLVFPGGFSFGDDLGSGKALSIKINHLLKDQLLNFLDKQRPIIGICNGFQVLTTLGLLPDFHEKRTVSLIANNSGKFINEWTPLKKVSSICKWAIDVDEKLELPIRHAEGRFIIEPSQRESIYEQLKENGQIVFEYENNPNGSDYNIAGICDPSGLILGMMPHPEAATRKLHHYKSTEAPLEFGQGHKIFSSVVNYLNNN